MYPPLSKCPVCKNDLYITRLHCQHCDTTIEGEFSSAANPFAALNPEQMQFVVSFIKCEGRLNRMEDELRLSYPTLKNRFNEILRTLGFEPAKEDAGIRLSLEERRQILEDLDSGKIKWEEAQRRLGGKAEDSAQS